MLSHLKVFGECLSYISIISYRYMYTFPQPTLDFSKILDIKMLDDGQHQAVHAARNGGDCTIL